MKKSSNLKMILGFTALTFFLTGFVILAWEQSLRSPFYNWVARKYPGEANRERRGKIEQRVEHFFISMTVDLIVVSILLGLVNHQQRRLAESEERYRALFKHANDGIAIVSAADFRIIEANHKFCEILDCQPSQILKRDIREVIRPDSTGADSTLLPALIQSAKETGEREMNVLTLAGASLPVAFSFSTISMDRGNLIIMLVRDLSARKQFEAEKEAMQQQLFQTSKLASVGELSAGVAHEINNPLNGIINFAQLLKDEEVERTEFERRLIDGIIEEGSRIAQIVRGLLAFARLDTHELSGVRIAETINTSISLFGRQLEKDGITVEIDVAGNLPSIRADGARLRQVVVNMISNAHHALRAKPSGEKIFRIKACSVERAGARALRLEFFDNGIGIRREALNKVFDPFFTTRRDTGGTGLGLSISFGIIRDHGGQITVESEEGSYTRFIVELPIGEETPEQRREAAAYV